MSVLSQLLELGQPDYKTYPSEVAGKLMSCMCQVWLGYGYEELLEQKRFIGSILD